MTSETVVTLSLRRWNIRDHARFWTAELAPSLAAAAVALLAAAFTSALVGPGDTGLTALSVILGACGLAYPAVTALYIARRRPPYGFDVVTEESHGVVSLAGSL